MGATASRAALAAALVLGVSGCAFEPAPDDSSGWLPTFEASPVGPDVAAAMSFAEADKLFIARDEFAYGRPIGRLARRPFSASRDPLLTYAEIEALSATAGRGAAASFDFTD